MRPWKKWLLRTSAAVVVTLTIYVVQDWWRASSARARLEEARVHLDAEDPGWRLDQIQAAREKAFPPDDQNITKLAVKIKADTPKEFDEFLTRAEQPTPWLPEKEFNHLPPPAKLADARKTRTVCRDVIERSLKLGTLTGGGMFPPPVANPLMMDLNHVQNARTPAALLNLNAVVLAADKDADGAVASCRATLNLTRCVNNEPTLISMLVRIAMASVAVQAAERTLAYTEPKAGLAEFQTELLREADEPVLAIGFRGERAWIDATFEYLQVDPDGLQNSGMGGPASLAALGRLAFRGRILVDQLQALRLETQYLEIARGPSHEWVEKMQGVLANEDLGPFVKLLLPAAEKVVLAALRIKARLRCLAVGIACERFRQANGRWPTDLAEIPKAILAAVPADPYTGEPLKYRVRPDGIVIYAVGDDRKDDGGNLTYSNPKPGEDVGVRLWSPEYRRAATLPEPKGQEP
ncbi:hypothetical protein [Limnoglobus roseus]|uniref:Uncharacterized protein n=1 Tax=Limnoglobus roseus TaxID=2598579 RepID=A0A5C1AAZ0_9BACT|nr:hypothetical protein [Limnoglobus roseus]QEL15745.1 hypothetical protein PX52LOC_02680 [Limnoglobus roseus]